MPTQRKVKNRFFPTRKEAQEWVKQQVGETAIHGNAGIEFHRQKGVKVATISAYDEHRWKASLS